MLETAIAIADVVRGMTIHAVGVATAGAVVAAAGRKDLRAPMVRADPLGLVAQSAHEALLAPVVLVDF